MMLKRGLVSVSFRQLSAEDVIRYASEAELEGIEWGSDVHAPCQELERLHEIAVAQAGAGLVCSSYGTYFRLGKDEPQSIVDYIRAAKILGTDLLRLWCGTKGYAEYTQAEKESLFADCKTVARIAEESGVRVAMECHNNTFTDCLDGALELMNAVNSPAFGMYWQPNQNRTLSENVRYATEIALYTSQIHVFYWLQNQKLPLEEGLDIWRQYLPAFAEKDHWMLLEFMPDGDPASLKTEAQSLRKLTESK